MLLATFSFSFFIHIWIIQRSLIVYLMKKVKFRNQRKKLNPFCFLTLDREVVAHLYQWKCRKTMPGRILQKHHISQQHYLNCSSQFSERRSTTSPNCLHTFTIAEINTRQPGSWFCSLMLFQQQKVLKVPTVLSHLPRLLQQYPQQENPVLRTLLR